MDNENNYTNDDRSSDIEFIINNELNRLKEEEKTLRDALFVKTRKYLFNNTVNNKNNKKTPSHINFNNQVAVVNHNKIDYDKLKWSKSTLTSTGSSNHNNNTNNNSKLDTIRNGLKYFEDLDANMHDCHLCSTHGSKTAITTKNDLTKTSSFWESSNEFLDSYLKQTQASASRKRVVSPTVQDLNKQQTLYYDHKKYVKPTNHVSFVEQNMNSNSIVSDYRRDIIRPETAVGRPRTAVERDYYSSVASTRNSINKKPTVPKNPLVRSSSTLFHYEADKNAQTSNNQAQKPKPWHYTSATLYPWRDRTLGKE